MIKHNDLRWYDAPKKYAPPKTLYNRWSDMGVFVQMAERLAAEAPDNETLSIHATYLKVHRTAFTLPVKKGGVDV